MPVKPYSFRYPYNLFRTILPWKKPLSQGSNEREYETVVSLLEDRDRSLEDYLSLGIGQGYLARAEVIVPQAGLVAAQTLVAGTLLTVTVPAGRLLQFDAHIIIHNGSAGNSVGTVQIREGTVVVGSTLISSRGVGLTPNGTITDFQDYGWTHFIAPTAGQHSYFLSAAVSGGGDIATTGATAPTLFSITDAGPAN